MMKLFFANAVLLALSCGLLFGQSDSLSEEDQEGPRRRPLAQFLVGISSMNVYSTPQYFGEDVPNSTVQTERVGFLLGLGAYFPVHNLGRISTLGVDASINAALSAGPSDYEPSSSAFDVAFPIFGTISYGGLYRRSVAWGVQGGLGFTVGRRFRHDAWTIAPTVMAEVIYAPKKAFKLRLTYDFIAASMTDTQQYRTLNVMFVYAWP